MSSSLLLKLKLNLICLFFFNAAGTELSTSLMGRKIFIYNLRKSLMEMTNYPGNQAGLQPAQVPFSTRFACSTTNLPGNSTEGIFLEVRQNVSLQIKQ